MAHEKTVAGLRCSQVLERLSDYLDGDLTPAQVAEVEAHLRGCDVCERFGGRFGTAVGELRRKLGAAPPLDAEQSARLWQAIEGELDD